MDIENLELEQIKSINEKENDYLKIKFKIKENKTIYSMNLAKNIEGKWIPTVIWHKKEEHFVNDRNQIIESYLSKRKMEVFEVLKKHPLLRLRWLTYKNEESCFYNPKNTMAGTKCQYLSEYTEIIFNELKKHPSVKIRL